MELKRLSWLHSYQYNSLPSEYKVMKKDYNKIRSELLRKIKRLDKIKDEVKCLNDEIGILSQKHNKLFRELEFINKSYNPKIYLNTYSKIGKGEYCQLIIKSMNTTKTIYLGSKSKIIGSFYNYIPNLTINNYEYKVSEFLKPIITQHFIKLNNPKSFLSNTFRLKDIIELLDS